MDLRQSADLDDMIAFAAQFPWPANRSWSCATSPKLL